MTRWVRLKLQVFVRDLLRNFCMGQIILEEQFHQFENNGNMDFESLRELIGHEHHKGLLWRLKDTAHHMFRNNPDTNVEGRFLDWGMGYIFHETIKLKEDSYQNITYKPWFEQLREGGLTGDEAEIAEGLFPILQQTVESMQRETDRIRHISGRCKKLMPIYLAGHNENPLLARCLVQDRQLIATVFGLGYEELVEKIYGGKKQDMFCLAAKSFRAGGRKEEAIQAIEKAVSLDPDCKIILQEKQIIDNWVVRVK
ncbi:MAG: tetratricopeptide repeat protein [Desulfovibrio sp.]